MKSDSYRAIENVKLVSALIVAATLLAFFIN